MGATRTTHAVTGRQEALEVLIANGCSAPRDWSNGPGDAYTWHQHTYHKTLFCLEGSIVFHTDEGDIDLHAGDRLDLDPGTAHAATIGPLGCVCVEASRP